MIPKLDTELRKGIRAEAFLAESANRKWSWRIGRVICNLAAGLGLRTNRQTVSDSLVLLVLMTVAIAIPAVSIVVSISQSGAEVASFFTKDYSELCDFPVSLGGYATGLLVAAFFCFTGGTSKRLHKISRSYPQPDVSLKRYLKRRTIAAVIVVFAASLIYESWFALAPVDRLTWMLQIRALFVAAIQAAFTVSLVLIAARKFVPSFDSILSFLGLVALPLFVFMVIGRFAPGNDKDATIILGYPQFLVAEDLISVSDRSIQLCFFPAWATNATTAFARSGDWVDWILILPVSIVILFGLKSYFELWKLTPEDLESELRVGALPRATTISNPEDPLALNPAQASPRSTGSRNAIPQDLKTQEEQKDFVFNRIDQLLAPPQTHQEKCFSFMPLDYRLTLASKRKQWKGLKRPEPVSSKLKRFWTEFQKIPAWALLFIIPLTVLGLAVLGGMIAVWFAWCFNVPDSTYTQLGGQISCFAIVVLSLLCLGPAFQNYHSSYLYPVNPWESIRTKVLAWGRILLLMLPGLGLLNLAFCWYYDLSFYEQLFFVCRPLIAGATLLMLGLGFQWSRAERESISLTRVLALTLIVVTTIGFGLGMFLPIPNDGPLAVLMNPTSIYLLEHLREISAVALLSTGVATMTSYVTLNHSRWVDVPKARNYAYEVGPTS